MMPEKNVSTIVLVQLPKKLSYLVGDKDIDPGGGQVCVIYNDGSFDIMAMANPAISFAFDFSSEGPSLVTVKYGNHSQMFQVFVREPVIRKFHITTPPAKRTYLVGEKLDLSGLELMAEYETGERVPYRNIPEIDYSVKRGDAVYPLEIAGITIPIYIKANDSKIVGIRMGKLPNIQEYLERKDKFEPAGATIIQKYDSGVEEEVPLPYSSVRGFSNLVPGPLTLTVQINNLSTTFEVKIIEKKVVKLTVDIPPFKTSYTEGEKIEMDGIRVSAEYDNGENHICEDWDYDPKTAKLGETIIQITSGAAKAQQPIVVSPRQLMSIRVSKLPDKTKYRENNEQLDVTGAELELSYDYGEPILVPMTNDMVKGFDNRRAGECRVEVQYQGLAANFTVDIIPQKLLGITVTQMPEKTEYAPGDLFDKKGLIVSGFYDSGQLAPLRSYIVEPDRPLKESDVAVLITSLDKKAVVPIKVGEMFRPKPIQPVEWTFPGESSGIDQISTDNVETASAAEALPSFIPEEENLVFRFSDQDKQEAEQKKEKKPTRFWGRKLWPPK